MLIIDGAYADGAADDAAIDDIIERYAIINPHY